jgi:hypothetical protein
MTYIKAFIAGIVLPSILLPFLLCFALVLGKPQILNIPFLHFIPFIWGIWNVLYFAIFRRLLMANVNFRLLLTGALLGLLIAIYGVFSLHIPEIIGLSSSLYYLPLILGPLLYAILWRLVVGPLNSLLSLNDS